MVSSHAGVLFATDLVEALWKEYYRIENNVSPQNIVLNQEQHSRLFLLRHPRNWALLLDWRDQMVICGREQSRAFLTFWNLAAMKGIFCRRRIQVFVIFSSTISFECNLMSVSTKLVKDLPVQSSRRIAVVKPIWSEVKLGYKCRISEIESIFQRLPVIHNFKTRQLQKACSKSQFADAESSSSSSSSKSDSEHPTDKANKVDDDWSPADKLSILFFSYLEF